MNVLVTGGSGFIGSVLVEEFLNDGFNVAVLDNLLYRQTSLLHHCYKSNFKFVCGDVRDKPLLVSMMQESDVIIPLAAIVGAPACDKDKQLATQVNYEQIRFIVENKSREQLLILPQTNSGYGNGQGTSFCTEDSPLRPLSHYGKTKCDAERVVLDYGGISLRLATVFGISPRMRLDLLVNNFTYEALTNGYIVLFEKDFKRNYIHIRDVVAAFRLMIEKYKPGEVFNVGLSSANLSKWELANKIKEYVPRFSIQVDEFTSDPDKRDYIVSNQKLESYGWSPKYSLDDGIKELIKGYKMLFAKQQIFSNL